MTNQAYSILLIFITISLNVYCQEKILIEPKPSNIFVEIGSHKQIINFDFLVSNQSTDTLSLNKLTVFAYDEDDNLLQTRFLDNNGTAPSIMILPKRIWEGENAYLIFNPFSEYEIAATIHKLVYEWTFSNNEEEDFDLKSTIYTKKYVQKIKLVFPLKGRILVYDAHDYTSHHRRFDYTFPPIKELGLKTNFMRYAYDFVVLNDNNEQVKDKGETDQDFFGFGSKIFAVANGKVIYVSNNHKDDKKFNVTKLKENPLELYGNCIAIQHIDNSISIYGHLKENSVKVKLGDIINANQEIAEIGVSGSSFFPHLHFEIRTSITDTAEGLPSYFENIFRLEGNLKKKIPIRLAETGNIIVTN